MEDEGSPAARKQGLRKFATQPLLTGSFFKRDRSNRSVAGPASGASLPLTPRGSTSSPQPQSISSPQQNLQGIIESLQAQVQVAEASVIRIRDDAARELEQVSKELTAAQRDASLSGALAASVCLVLLVLELVDTENSSLRIGISLFCLVAVLAIDARHIFAPRSKPRRTCVCGKWVSESDLHSQCSDCQIFYGGFKDKYTLMGVLGKGSYATVRTAINRQANLDVAVKVVSKPSSDAIVQSRLVVEVRALQTLVHPSIVKFLDWYEDDKNFYIVTELISGGELLDRIAERPQWCENDARNVVRVLADALSFVHQRGYVHRDIKPENILLRSKSDSRSLVLVDFGFVAKVKKRGLTDACGTPLYVAPEIVSGVAYGTAVDVWSLGIILFVLLGGSHPFAQRKQVDMFRAMRKGELDFDPLYWSRISSLAKDAVQGCLAVDPANRLSMPGLLAHPWMSAPADGTRLENSVNFKSLRLFNAKRKLKGMILAAIAAGTLSAIAVKVRQEAAKRGRRSSLVR